MSWISDGRGVVELSRKKSMRRPSASYYSSVGGESILRAADKASASKIPPPGRSWRKHRRLGPLMVNSTPNVRAAPAPAGSRP
jgi:hypothetical protein